jgi:hypothetical protein
MEKVFIVDLFTYIYFNYIKLLIFILTEIKYKP